MKQFPIAYADMTFEIPDEWWGKSGAPAFRPDKRTYSVEPITDSAVTIVAMSEVRPPMRNAGAPGLCRKTFMSILKGFVDDDAIPAIEACRSPPASAFPVDLRDGYHRFYACAAVGFTHLPLRLVDYSFKPDASGSGITCCTCLDECCIRDARR